MSDTQETDRVYFHDCPIFGSNTRVPKVLVTDNSHNYALYYQHKCICNYIAAEKEMAPGITETQSGYKIDLDKAEKLYTDN